eukprot:4817881-Prorocentrum_lima.AAC.1
MKDGQEVPLFRLRNLQDETKLVETLPKPALQHLREGTLKAAVASRVQELQRADPISKQMWTSFCDSHGHLQHDPAAHDEASLT